MSKLKRKRRRNTTNIGIDLVHPLVLALALVVQMILAVRVVIAVMMILQGSIRKVPSIHTRMNIYPRIYISLEKES